ncbi:protein kinase [Trypanosoma brucei equiperdum]|uniref:non-specific serine/threonine protein kinase n=1 Tax=Trypanosoma brucei equiperdum TaxID=630700 RepID=A0A3L6L6W0_9TRYP|nr:protein kinase [Trypanosoma brucei equiperdum]
MPRSGDAKSSGSEVACRTFDPCQLNLSSATPVGSGAISHVVRTTLQGAANTPIAVKILSKIQLLQQKKVQSAMNEKRALLDLAPHPFIARLYGTAQSEDELYFVMEHLPHGDLLEHIRTRYSRHSCRRHSEDVANTPSDRNGLQTSSSSTPCLDFHDIQLITAQLVVGLAHVFAKGFVLRDLKPENIVFDEKYRACLVDFDTVDVEGRTALPISNKGVAVRSKRSSGEGKDGAKKRLTISSIQTMRRNTANFCGTAQYVSPEMVGECRWSYSSDLWALGTVVYEMLYGKHMFSGDNAFKVMKAVVKGVSPENVPFPRVDIGPEFDAFERTKDFIVRLCHTDPTQRLGVNPITGMFDLDVLRQHDIFGDFCWDVLDEHVQQYRPVDISANPNECAAPASFRGPLHPQMLSDHTASLESHYHAVPVHNPEYAEYVYTATADVNPFERWACGVVEKDANYNVENEAVTRGLEKESVPKLSAENSECDGSDDDDDDISVIDDVGVQYFNNVHEDFMK